MRIRKDKITRNNFIRAGGIWIRDFTSQNSISVSPNNLTKPDDRSVFVFNEHQNHTLNIGNISDEQLFFPKVVIVSDGKNFHEYVEFINNLPSDVYVFAVNGALSKWRNLGFKKPINLYIVNNPYQEALTFLPKKTKYYPACVASVRTHFKFLKEYIGTTYVYEPAGENGFGQKINSSYYIDDYRNPICAAIGLAWKMSAYKVMLLGTDESFSEYKSGSEKLNNGTFAYPQQIMAHEIIDANIYWYKYQKQTEFADYSNGLEYNNASYITTEEQAREFFMDDEDKPN